MSRRISPCVLAGLALALASSALIGQVSSLSIGFIQDPCPDPACVFIRIGAGDPVPVMVSAFDSSGGQAIGYRGTVSFSSSDPLASLPAPYAFTAADSGWHYFTGMTILRTVGQQTVTVTDTASGASSSASILVMPAQVSTSIPVMTGGGRILAVCFLAVVGLWLIARPI